MPRRLPEPPPIDLPTWKRAWDTALYGPAGFFRREAPAAHFRTSVHASPLFARAVVALAHEEGLDTVVDIGAGRGELLTAIRAIDPHLDLLGVEVAARPSSLDAAIAWTAAVPESVDGLVVANEWLDDIPCHVVEVGDDEEIRVVHVDPATGEETLGAPVDHPSVPSSLGDWLDRWWPLDRRVPGSRAEVGTTRDSAWSDVVRRVGHGVAVAVDYGHLREARPTYGSLRSYRLGREVDVVPDGSRDVTAHVAVDSLGAAVGGEIRRQRDLLGELGVAARVPDRALATTDPAGYLESLSSADEAAELLRRGGLGDFWWILTRR
jgi:SAM-dependent MidA family methyltransferase